MLFETPLLSNLPPVATSSSSNVTSTPKKRKHGGHHSSASSAANKDEAAVAGASINLDKLLKKMKGIDSNGDLSKSASTSSPSGHNNTTSSRPNKKPKSSSNATSSNSTPVGHPRNDSVHPEGTKKKNHKNGKGKKADVDNRSSSSDSLAKSKSPKAVQQTVTMGQDSDEDEPQDTSSLRYAAPNHEEMSAGGGSSMPQTSMQASLRAKLAGGKFRMLNETLYTTTGKEAWKTMKAEGAFDDYHSGFRSQAATWPVHPLTLIKKDLASNLPPSSLIADFGCGDATLARELARETAKKGLKVISFDLVSKDGWVIEAECSSVPLPGGRQGGQIVDVVVCCLSLMGTDWVKMIREATRVLKSGGQLKIAEVSSRFTNIDAFVALVCTIGFKLTCKDTSNSHFIMFDFVKSGDENSMKQAETTKKAADLLRPCIYKKR